MEKIPQSDEYNCRDITINNITENITENSSQIVLGKVTKAVYSHAEAFPSAYRLALNVPMKQPKLSSFSTMVIVKTFCNKALIRRSSFFKKYWDIIMEFILVYNVITTLYFLAYSKPGKVTQVIDFICWIFFIFNIVITFFAEQTTEQDKPIQDLREIAKIYITGWFVPDVVAIIPLTSLGYPQAEYLLRMFRLLKMPKALNITDGNGISFFLTFFDLGSDEKKGRVAYKFTTRVIMSLIQLLIIIIFSVYFLGCFFFWFQHLVNNERYSSKDISVVDETSFENYYSLTSISSEHIALKTSYFILTTMSTIGYGDYYPKNVYEMAFIMVVMLAGVTLFGVIIGNFNTAITNFENASTGSDMIGKLNNWLDSVEMSQGKIDKTLRNKILSYFTYYFSKDRLKALAKNSWEASSPQDLISISQEYVKDLPEFIYYEILDKLFEDFMNYYKCYFGESSLRYDILPYLQPRQFLVGEYVAVNKEPIDEIVFLQSGSVSIGFELNGNHQTLLFCGEGTILGDYCSLSKVPNRFDYLVMTNCDTFVIDKETFLSILDNFYRSDKINLLAISFQRERVFCRYLVDFLNSSGLEAELIIRYSKKYSVELPKEHKAPTEVKLETIEKDLSILNYQSSNIKKKSTSLLSLVNTTENIRKTYYYFR